MFGLATKKDIADLRALMSELEDRTIDSFRMVTKNHLELVKFTETSLKANNTINQQEI